MYAGFARSWHCANMMHGLSHFILTTMLGAMLFVFT
jgi:hypothetical protein